MSELRYVKSYAKINLYLRVLGKSGHLHELSMINVLIDYFDEMDFTITPSETSFIETIFEPDCYHIGKDNLVNQAFYYCAPFFKQALSVIVRIKKNIPPGTGLGGGSGNAAQLIEILRPYLIQSFHHHENTIAKSLGSDVPFFLYRKPSLVTGTGENIQALPFRLPPWWLLLVIPNFSCSTAEVYRVYDLMLDQKKIFTISAPKDFKNSSSIFPLVNDLYFPAMNLEPRLMAILSDLKKTQALDCTMSGSGSSCYGIYSEKSHAQDAYTKLLPKYSRLFLCQLIHDE